MKLEALNELLPEKASGYINQWLENEAVIIIVKNERKTKLGDYKFNQIKNKHQITLNHGLSKEAFFFVFTHEIAHLMARNAFGPNVRSHGKEWKLIFGKLLLESLEVYPEELKGVIYRHSQNPRASVSADKYLYKELFLDEESELRLIENLDFGQKFRLGKRVFQRGEKRKIRYICKEIKTGKLYLVNGRAVADEILNYE